jgi:pimeloyl-ACP methyl ester carboxylesterase/DNA-binding CsgD family transcriptional regulator
MSVAQQQIRFCTSRDGTRIAYAIAGRGPPLLWTGHFLRHIEFDWDSPVWRPWRSLLMECHTLIRYDWRGFGLSDREGVQFSLEKHVEDLEALVEAVHLSHFVLFASSGGGTPAIAYAVRHPDRVSRLVLYGCPSRGRMARGETTEQAAERQTLLKMIEVGWANDAPAYDQFFTKLHIPDANAEQFRSYHELFRRTASPANVVGLLTAYFQSDALAAVAKIRCPTLVLHARGDPMIPVEEGRLIASLVPGARFVPLDSRNHIVLETEPAWQDFAQALRDFLPSSPASAGIELDELTAREREVLELVAQGADNSKIASRLKISEKTVRNHLSLIFGKLGIHKRAEAVARARDAGLGRWPTP